MYQAFGNMRNLVRTETNSRIFLDDPKSRDGKLNKYVSYISYGTMEVITQPQVLATLEDSGPLHVLPWHIENMQGEGKSPIGTIKVIGDPQTMTTGVIRQNVASLPFPATLEASVFQVFDIPGYGILRNRAQVVISATVDAIPPFEAACQCSRAFLYDEENRVRGMVDGRVLTILPPN
jgi:hypothetical protein